MNMMVKVAENQCEAPCPNLASGGPPSKPLRTISLSPHHQRKKVVECSRTWKNSWARMSFKLTRSMVLCKGKVVDKFHFQVDGNAIPPINEKPVKCLSKIFACSLRDTKVIQAIINISFSLGLLLSRNMAYQAIIRS